MQVIEFFEQCAGKWFSQRTSHSLPPQELEAGQSQLWIELLPTTDPTVLELCKQGQISPDSVLCGLQTKWEGTVGASSAKETGTALLVAVADANDTNTGKLLQQGKAGSALSGRYTLNTDESLTLTLESDSFKIEERLWFVSANLRERTSTIQHADGSSYASFCSEIRMGVQTPA
ncbi:MAG: phycobiliprotein lyase [Cyanobacteriota bacterium]|nr:phycobiliprotein lyase [Cyanobacteriota bacterium]